MKETQAHKSYEKTTFIIKTTTIALVFFDAISLIALIICSAIFDGSDGFMITLFVLTGMIAVTSAAIIPLFLATKKRVAILNLYIAYSRVLSHNPNNAVTEIWQARGTSKEEIVSDFKALDSLGFFDSININEQEQVVNVIDAQEPSHEFICPNCLGTTIVEDGKNDLCAFCGTIKEKDKD